MRRLYEWKQLNSSASNNSSNNSSTTSASSVSKNEFKNRFKKLLDYAQKHTAPIVTKTEVVKLTDYSFEYKEYLETDDEYYWTSTVTVNTSRFDDKWSIRVKTDETTRATKFGEGYEDLIRALGFYMNIPNYGTPEYDDLLVESLTETAEDFKNRKENSIMKLYEEFKEYENLWEALEDEGTQTEKEFRSEYARLSSTPEGREQLKAMDFRKRRELEQADRKTRPSYKLLSSYYTITLEYEDYNYEADAHRVFEAIHDILCFEENLAKMSNRELANKYDELWDAWSNATPEDSLEAEEAFDYFVAENLDEFVSELYDELLEDFDDFATEWAKDAGLYRWED